EAKDVVGTPSRALRAAKAEERGGSHGQGCSLCRDWVRCDLLDSPIAPQFCRCSDGNLGHPRCRAATGSRKSQLNNENTLRISHSTRERVRSIGKDGNNGSQGQT